MHRNSSFFWASDDLVRNGGGDQLDDYEFLRSRSENGPRVTVGVDPILWEEETDEDEITQATTTDEETASLNKTVANGYGSAQNGNDDERHFERRETWHGAGPASPVKQTNVRRRLFLSPKEEEDLRFKSIRFQVVIWHIGMIDVQTGFVKLRFRLTLFWNDDGNDGNDDGNATNNGGGGRHGVGQTSPTKSLNADDDTSIWVMEGRQRACRKTWSRSRESMEMIDVPPVSVLNAVELETVDEPEIAMVNPQTRGMRWTCMYTATLFQGDHLSVKDFPHDEHQIKLKLGILAHRASGGRWDHNLYRLGLAREEDSLGSTRVPHGLVVEHCHIPDFGFDPADLDFQFLPLTYGGRKYSDRERDVFLQVTLPCHRQSGHYDTSILPILIMLNIIAISCLTRNFASATAATEIMLSIAFVQVGIRLTMDGRLPSVGYQIKMQRVMNGCFWLLCGLVLESNAVFFLVTKRGWRVADTDRIDVAAAVAGLAYNCHICRTYFRGMKRWHGADGATSSARACRPECHTLDDTPERPRGGFICCPSF